MRRSVFALLVLVGLLALLVVPASAAAPAAPPVVSYQGQVKVGGVPYDGPGYFKFAVVNQAGSTSYWSNDGASAGGSEPALPVSLAVSNGLFNVLLGDTTLGGMTQPLSAAAFTGTDRFLRVWFSSDNVTFTQLGPDRRIASVPFALRVEKEQNVVIVARTGGDFTSVQAALDSITDAGADNPYLIRVAPGVYTEKVTMKPWVDIEGSGELVTKITFQKNATNAGPTLTGADNAELRFLTIEIKGKDHGGEVKFSAMVNNGVSPRLTHVTIMAEAVTGTFGTGTAFGVQNLNGAPILTDVTVRADAKGALNSNAILNSGAATEMRRVHASATGGRYSNVGIDNHAMFNSVSPILRDSVVTATGATGVTNMAVRNRGSDYKNRNAPVMVNVTATASGGTGKNSVSTGVYNDASEPTLTSVVAKGSGGELSINRGVYGGNHSIVKVNNSEITGATNTILIETSSDAYVGSSLLNGGAVSGSPITCAGVHDEAYAFYASTCP